MLVRSELSGHFKPQRTGMYQDDPFHRHLAYNIESCETATDPNLDHVVPKFFKNFLKIFIRSTHLFDDELIKIMLMLFSSNFHYSSMTVNLDIMFKNTIHIFFGYQNQSQREAEKVMKISVTDDGDEC